MPLVVSLTFLINLLATPLSRVVPPLYEDGVYQPSGSTRPNPLDLSERLMSPNNTKMMKQTKSYRNASVIMVFFGKYRERFSRSNRNVCTCLMNSE